MESGISEELEAMEAIYSREEVEVVGGLSEPGRPGTVVVKMDKRPVLTLVIPCKQSVPIVACL